MSADDSAAENCRIWRHRRGVGQCASETARPQSDAGVLCRNPSGIYFRNLNALLFTKMSLSVRTNIAVVICSASAVIGALWIYRGWGSVSSTAFNVGFAWLISGSWLAGEFTREGWKRLNSPIAAIYRDAQQGKLRSSSPLARMMRRGGSILVLAGIVSWFV
jgi:hypothetical protein